MAARGAEPRSSPALGEGLPRYQQTLLAKVMARLTINKRVLQESPVEPSLGLKRLTPGGSGEDGNTHWSRPSVNAFRRGRTVCSGLIILCRLTDAGCDGQSRRTPPAAVAAIFGEQTKSRCGGPQHRMRPTAIWNRSLAEE
jgi:hypothetical protein